MDNDAGRYRRFLNGDDNGLREIIDTHYNGLTLYINGIVKDPSETEDIVQETFVKIAVKKPNFNPNGTFKTWLFTIARNTAYNYLKRYKSRISDQPIDEYIMLSDGTNVEKEHLKTQQNIELHRAMKELNPDYFQVLYLMYFENLDTEGIATVMHKSKRQIGDLLYRSKKSLKSILEKAGFQYEDF
ncbi:RNA polymerase sigma factor [Ruminococcus sp.]|uniref:RNA polymerase sigma factor n=1 Tax=Ruminococcus sp. TaxID=41978 RepID=UPI0025F986C7|nr:RNA polymerase sigma factor [Ruminococcus sp.]